jgi:2-iminobutanoate/2-iminopropanoate deaminase
VLQVERFGFTNCVRYRDVLYLSGIGALDVQGRVVGEDIETQTVKTFENIERIL